jgi:hypothetical protein
MQGDRVIVRAYGDVPLVRRVWDEDEKGVYITDDPGFDQLIKGQAEFWPVGFPREDVFKFNQQLINDITALCKCGKWDWSKLDPF